MEVDPRLLWKDGAYNDHSCIHDEWKHVATKYNDAVGVEVCRIVRLRDYKDDVRVGVGVECILCGPNKHYTAQFDENGTGVYSVGAKTGAEKSAWENLDTRMPTIDLFVRGHCQNKTHTKNLKNAATANATTAAAEPSGTTAGSESAAAQAEVAPSALPLCAPPCPRALQARPSPPRPLPAPSSSPSAPARAHTHATLGRHCRAARVRRRSLALPGLNRATTHGVMPSGASPKQRR